jgi:hypothetical protein
MIGIARLKSEIAGTTAFSAPLWLVLVARGLAVALGLGVPEVPINFGVADRSIAVAGSIVVTLESFKVRVKVSVRVAPLHRKVRVRPGRLGTGRRKKQKTYSWAQTVAIPLAATDF